MEKQLSNKLRWFSFLMTILVVCYHAAPHFIIAMIGDEISKQKPYCYIRNFYDSFGSIALVYFFAASAFLFYAKEESFGCKIKKRIRTLVIPFAVWNLIYCMFFLFVERNVIGYKRIILGFTLEPFDGPLWYIVVLFVYLFLEHAFSVRKRSCKNGKAFWVIWWLIFFVSVCYHKIHVLQILKFPFDYYVERLIRFVPAFLFGLKCSTDADASYTKAAFVGGSKSAKALLVISLVFVILVGESLVTPILLYFITLLLWMSFPNKSVDYNIGRFVNTFVIFAAHDALIRVLLALFYKILPSTYFGNSIAIFMVPVFVTLLITVFCAGISAIVNKNHVFKALLAGGR